MISHFDFLVDGLKDRKAAEELLDAIIALVERRGADMCGGFHVAGTCPDCTDDEAGDGS